MARRKSNNRGGGKGGDTKGGDESRGGGGDRRGSKPGGSDSGSGSGSGGSAGGGSKHRKKDVRNARSLADVLSGNKGRSSAPSPSGRVSPGGRPGPDANNNEDRRHAFNRGADNRGSDAPVVTGPGGKAPPSKKLTYIMSFQTPEERKANAAKNEDPIIAEAEVSRPRTQFEEPPKRSRFDENPTSKKNSPSRDSFLSKQRNEPPAREAQRGAAPVRKGGVKTRGSQQPDEPVRGTQKGAPDRSQESRGKQKPPPMSARSNARAGNRGSEREKSPERAPQAPARTGSAWPQNRVTTPISTADPVRDPKKTGRSARPDARHVTGMIKRHPDGFGFLIVDQPDTPDVYVARQSMTGIMTNDRVEVELYRPRSGSKTSNGSNPKEDRLSGEIVQVLSRANTRVVGRYLPVDKKYGILQDANRGWGADLRIAADDSMGAKDGELIAVEITQYPDDEHEFTGKVVSIIGDSEDPINDVIRVVHQAGIPTEFSKEAVGDAQKFGGKVTEQERKGREDLTQLPLITIDGVTAKDFDDAIYTEQTARGFHLIVAIADVSHYVKPGSRLDEEAYERGTSTYFPNYVVPMLPEELSNELCSLKPDVLRLCFCCDMNINFNGDVQDFRFFEGVMQSQARVTYGEAQEVIDAYDAGEENKNKTAKKLAHVSENILKSRDLAKILMAKRFRDGSLDLEIPETQVVVDATGESTDIIRASRIFAHRLIEELMLVTNICTARYMDESKIPGIYRIHEEPDADKIADLQRFLWNMGGSKSVSGGNLAKKLTAALESMAGKPEAQILNILTLRTMQQAHYSEQNVGHFGLGFSHYSHFTSPIRRYPDLIAHRLIKSVLYDKYHGMRMQEDEIASATTWLSATEQRSTKAERKVISIKKARFIRRYEGQEFDGMVSSVAKFGCFVLLKQYDVDGLIKIEKLGNDRFEFDEDNLVLRGRKTGLTYTIGDQVRVRVVSADTETGKVDFELAEEPAGKGASSADDEGPDEFGDAKGRSKRGARKEQPGKGAKKGGKPEAKSETKSGSKRQDAKPSQRGPSEDNRRGVRKERVSKRRGKN